MGIHRSIALLSFFFLWGCASEPTVETTRASSPVDRLSGSDDIEGFARVMGPRVFNFPEDHGPHPDYQTEWWYLTGHLDPVDGGPGYGFQWTIFRRALAPPSPTEEAGRRTSAWATRQLYMGHFALTDLGRGEHLSFERFSRGAAGLAGAKSEPFAVWLEDWRLESASAGLFPLDLAAKGDEHRLSLRITSRKPHVLQGDRGFSRKNDLPGGASYYYSYTRLEATGTVEIDGKKQAVEGEAWLDREWSTSVLSPEQKGWDWFSLQLDGDRELMIYQLRTADGRADPFSYGIWIEPDGSSTTFGKADFDLRVTDRWTSPRSGGEYPAGWTLSVPSRELELVIRPLLADQELDVSFRYWEGAVEVSGKRAGKETAGRGFVELVGYGEGR